MCEQSNANDAAALRREARRRKILENSTSRLKSIEGILSSTSDTTSQGVSEHVEDVPHETKEKSVEEIRIDRPTKMSEIRDMLKENKDLKQISDHLLQDISSEETDIFEPERVSSSEETNKKSNIFVLVHKKRLHYVFLAVIVNLFLYFNIGHFFYNNIFCPFLTVKTMEILSGQFEMEAMMFILIASLPKRLQKPGKIFLTLLPSLFSDLFLYIFTFVMGTKILNLSIE